MQFNLQTIVALITTSAILMTLFTRPTVGAVAIFALPVALMLIGISSPQNGNPLELSSRWYFFLFLKTFAFTLIALMVIGMVCFCLDFLGLIRL